METAPRNCRFLSLVVVELVLSLYDTKNIEIPQMWVGLALRDIPSLHATNCPLEGPSPPFAALKPQPFPPQFPLPFSPPAPLVLFRCCRSSGGGAWNYQENMTDQQKTHQGNWWPVCLGSVLGRVWGRVPVHPVYVQFHIDWMGQMGHFHGMVVGLKWGCPAESLCLLVFPFPHYQEKNDLGGDRN